MWGLPVFLISFGIFFISVEIICKLQLRKDRSDENKSDEIKADEKKEDSEGYLDFIKSLTPLGFGVSLSFIAEFIYKSSVGSFGNDFEKYGSSTSDLIMDMAIFSFAQIIGFVIFFYIVYGILVLIKSHNGNEQDQRNFAGWISVIFDLGLIVFVVS